MNEQTQFHSANRQKLRKATKAQLLVITGHSQIQASGDRAYPFQQDNNFLYLTGINEPGIILVMDGDDEYLIVPERSDVRIAFEGAVDTKSLTEVSGVEKFITWSELVQRFEKVDEVGVLMPNEPYIEHDDMFVNPSRQRLLDRIGDKKFVDLRPQLTRQRMIKSRYEIKMIKQAIKHTNKLFKIIERKRDKVMSEHELLAEVTKQALKDQLVYAYEPIIASGMNAVTLHYVQNNSAIDKSAPLLLDIGLAYNGYAADITRTVVSEPTKRQQAVYDAVLEVQEYAIAQLKPGANLKECEENVVKLMGEKLIELGLITENTKENVRKYYPHSTSHFLGLDVHDVGDYTLPLKPGMVLTVEPGIYIPEEAIGVRIEDDVLITRSGNKVLTNQLPKRLRSLTIAN